jgi:prevent-host-death family protein
MTEDQKDLLEEARDSISAADLLLAGGFPGYAVKDDLSKYLRLAEKEEVIITRHGKPAGILIGFASEDDWFDYRLEHDPRFLARIERARRSIRSGRGVKLEEAKV